MRFDGPLLAERWRLGPRLGAGGQGHTSLARDERDPARVVVVKQLRLGGESGWKRFDLFEREVATLRALAHPGVPGFLDHFEGAPGVFYLVMERAPGRDLREVMRDGVRYTGDELRDILARALDILVYLHGLEPPVIHRDIKPANLVRAADGRLSLVDFGGVRAAARPEGGSTVIGTFGYMAPEQLHGQATPATDIYGLGATIVALAGGVEPEDVPRKGLRMDLERHLRGRDAELLALLGRMTDPDPEARPQSAREVRALLGGRARAAAPAAGEEAGKALVRAADDDEVLELDMSMMPPMLRRPLVILLRLIGVAGNVGLTVLRAILLPVLFTLVSAFCSRDHRVKLRAAQRSTNLVLDSGRRGFRRLQRGRFRPPKQLPPGRLQR